MTTRQLIASRLDPRLRSALKLVYDEFRMLRNHKRGVRTYRDHVDSARPLRVQFGCGPEPKEGWLNTDIWPGPWATPDICLDVARPFPFPAGSVAEIYTEHMFEHLSYPTDAAHFLQESFRVLIPGGTLTIGVPDLEAIHDHYFQSLSAKTVVNSAPHILLGHPLEDLNYAFHQDGEHKFVYSDEFLIKFFEHFGLIDVRGRDFDPIMDSEHRRGGTLYVTGVKPPSRVNI